jgi:hypothetical protein
MHSHWESKEGMCLAKVLNHEQYNLALYRLLVLPRRLKLSCHAACGIAAAGLCKFVP